MKIYFWNYKQLIIRSIFLLIILLGCIISFDFFNPDLMVAMQNQNLQPIYRGSDHFKRMALTFNVDWGEDHLPGIFKSLKESQVKATFFLTGRWTKKFPALAKEIAGNGYEIGNHGYSHPHPDQIGKTKNQQEIAAAEQEIFSATGRKTTLFAPPYGEHTNQVLDASGELGYKTILWTIDTIDWDQKRSPQMIFEKVKSNAQNGAIVLMHPTDRTLEALPRIIQDLKQKGYELLTVSEILQ